MHRRSGLEITETIEDACDPATMAVLVYDMQAGVVVTDACGGRDRPAMERVLDDFRFSGDALLTDIATITPLLAPGDTRP